MYVKAIADFDLLKKASDLAPLFERLGGNFSLIRTRHDVFQNEAFNDKSKPKNHTKTTGHRDFSPALKQKFQVLNEALEKRGIFVVPVGELESFYSHQEITSKMHGPSWVNKVLELNPLISDLNQTAFDSARDFMRRVITGTPEPLQNNNTNNNSDNNNNNANANAKVKEQPTNKQILHIHGHEREQVGTLAQVSNISDMN